MEAPKNEDLSNYTTLYYSTDPFTTHGADEADMNTFKQKQQQAKKKRRG